MGWLKNLLLGGAAAKTYQNVYNRPIVTPPPGYVIREMKQKGFGSTWVVKYSKSNQMNITAQFTISSSTRSVGVGADSFKVDWPQRNTFKLINNWGENNEIK